MLIRSSRRAQALTKEAFVKAVAKKLTKGIRADVGALRKSTGINRKTIGMGPLEARGAAWKSWKPKSNTGKAAKWTAANPLKATMAAGGVAGGAYVAGSGASKAYQAAKSTTSDPYALARRRAQGFRG